MSVATASAMMLTDGDAAFLRVDNRRPPHALEPGVVWRAKNKRFEDGKAWPRFGIAVDPWGIHQTNLATGEYPSEPPFSLLTVFAIQLTPGQRYRYRAGNSTALAQSFDVAPPPSGAVLGIAGETTAEGFFIAQGNGVYGVVAPIASVGETITAEIYLAPEACAYARFNDPTTDTDNGILITDEWRESDGGRGRCWRIQSGNGPQEIPLNGQSVWGTARLIHCHTAMVLLRHGNERHYFSASSVNDALNDRITLTGAPSWAVGAAKRVRFELAQAGSGIYGVTKNITDTDATADTITVASHGLTNGDGKVVTGLTGLSGIYYVRSVTSSTLSLYDTSAHAIAGGATGLIDITVNDETGTLADQAPAAGNYYYAKRTSANIIELYKNLALTDKILYSSSPSPNGRFFIESAVDPVPFFGNTAPPLILQPGSAGELPFDNGWQTVSGNVLITGTASNIITAPNHRFAPGDSVSGPANSLKESTGPDVFISWPKFAAPQSDRTLRLYTSAAAALADDGSTGLQTVLDGQSSLSLYKTGAAGLPMPGGREGCYINGRLWIINGDDEVLFSDPHDFLHFTRFMSQVTANQGEAGRANWLAPLGEDVLAIGKNQKIIAISGIGGAVSTWKEGTITDEYGGIAALAVVQSGTDLQFASRKGWASAIRTIAGERLGITRTVSHGIPQYLQDIDWGQAALMCAETWGNRLFWAVPTKGQSTPINNRVLVLNFDNSQLYLEQSAVAGEIIGGVRQYPEGSRGVDSWEGEWTGELLTPYAFCRLTVNTEERLTFVTPDGIVCWLHDGWDDVGGVIEDELITRGYFGSKEVLALKGAFRWETFQPKLSAWIRSAGYNEEEQLEGFDELEYDRTRYLVDGQEDYDPNTSTTETFDAPHREDYSPAPEELLVARLDVHQALAEPFRCRVRDGSIQFRLLNEQGSARIIGVTLQAKPVGISATRKT